MMRVGVIHKNGAKCENYFFPLPPISFHKNSA